MRTLLTYFEKFPRRSIIMLTVLLLAGLAEGLSLTTLLPLLSTASGSAENSAIGRYILQTIRNVGLEPSIGVMLLIVVGGMILKSIILLLSNRQVGYTVAHIATVLRLELLEALMLSRWQYFLTKRVGSLANSVATEAYRAANGFENSSKVLALSIQVVVYSAVALLVSWQATLSTLAVSLVLLFALHRLVLASRRAGVKQTHLMKHLLAYLLDILGSVKSLKAMARDNVADAILKDQTRQLEIAIRQEVMSREALFALQEPILAILIASGLYLALVVWELPLPAVLVLVLLLARVLALLNKTQRLFQQLSAQESAYWSLRKATEEAQAEAEINLGTKVPTLREGITLHQIRLNFGIKPIFEDLNAKLPVNSFTAIMGPSGAGKSTLLDVLCGLVKPDSGDIFIDGVPLREIDLRQWRRMIGYVSQDTILLHDSVLNNVIVGEPDLEESNAIEALHQADAWDFVQALPEGLHTVVGERGGLISGGQRQRIAIARALAHKPRFLILDEPTSDLDLDSDAIICATLQKLAKSLTVIAVSHQTAIIRAADHVFKLEEGRMKLINDGSTIELQAQANISEL